MRQGKGCCRQRGRQKYELLGKFKKEEPGDPGAVLNERQRIHPLQSSSLNCWGKRRLLSDVFHGAASLLMGVTPCRGVCVCRWFWGILCINNCVRMFDFLRCQQLSFKIASPHIHLNKTPPQKNDTTGTPNQLDKRTVWASGSCKYHFGSNNVSWPPFWRSGGWSRICAVCVFTRPVFEVRQAKQDGGGNIYMAEKYAPSLP